MQPDVIVIDYETTGLNYYEKAFGVTSLAAAWMDKGEVSYWYSSDLDNIEAFLERLNTLQVPIIAHNISFEIGVTKCQYPHLSLNWWACTSKMSQLWDNGGQASEDGNFGLEACVGRILPEKYWMHKEPAYQWIRDNVKTTVVKEYKKKPSVTIERPIKRGQEHHYLDRLPPEVLEQYNRADVEVTLRLYQELERRFECLDFNWRTSTNLYLEACQLIIDSKIRGVKVNLDEVKKSLEVFKQQLVDLDIDFRKLYPEEIAAIEAANGGKAFNIRSTKNLKELFVDSLGIAPKILTKANKKTGTGGGRPSFSKKHLGQWGDKASILTTKGSLGQVIGASEGLIALVEASEDKRWHCDLKSVGTKTERYAGGGGLNLQGLPRRNKLFMQNLVADDGYTFVSMDLCYPMDNTQVLTRDGWKAFDELSTGEEVLQVDSESLKGSWVVPSRVLSYSYTGELVTYHTARGCLQVTKGHTMLFVGQQNHPTRKDKEKYRKTIKAGEELPNSGCHFALSTLLPTESNYSYDEIDMVCLLAADSHYVEKEDSYTVEVSKERKVIRVKELLKREGNKTKIHGLQVLQPYKWNYIKFKSPLLDGKRLELDSLGSNQADVFVECLLKWDGSKREGKRESKRGIWTTTVKREAEEVQRYLVTSGYEARLTASRNDEVSTGYVYKLSILKKGCIRFNMSESIRPSGNSVGSKILHHHETLKVGCVTVPSGFVLVRQGGQTFVCGNCQGEPTVTTHYSGDENYRRLMFDMVGKDPYYENDILYCDSLYVMVGSISPMYSGMFRTMWSQPWPTGTFSQQWVDDSDVIKKSIPKEYALLKALSLAIGYGQGAKGMQQTALEAGQEVSLPVAKAFWNSYWSLFPGVKNFAAICQATVERDGCIINEFGYRCVPQPHKAFNALIQSSVSGIINLFIQIFFKNCPWARFVTVIHDEVIYSVPKEKVKVTKEIADKCIMELNQILDWTVQVRFGFTAGENFYTAK